MEHEHNLDKALYDISLAMKRLLQEPLKGEIIPSHVSGIKLPKIEVPTFDRNVMK